MTNHIDTINEASRHKKDVHSYPTCFEQYKALNVTKKKKIKHTNLSGSQLHSHSQALYGLLLKPVMKSTSSWCKAEEKIKSLADCLNAYKCHLDEQLQVVTKNHEMDHPVRTVGEFTTVEHRRKTMFGLKDRYAILNDELLGCEAGTMLFFNEETHVVGEFQNNMQRHRFLSELQLTVPIDMFRYCPGSSLLTIVGLVHVNENRPAHQVLNDCARFALENHNKFSEYHTRAQKRSFKVKLENIARISPMVADFMYKE